MVWNDLNIGKKIAFGFSIMIFASAIIGGISFYNMSKIEKASVALSEEYIPVISKSYQLTKNWQEVINALQSYDQIGSEYNFEQMQVGLVKFNESLNGLIAAGNKSEAMKGSLKVYAEIKVEADRFSSMLDGYQSIVTENESYLANIKLSIQRRHQSATIKNQNGPREFYSRIDKASLDILMAVHFKLPHGLSEIKDDVQRIQTDYQQLKRSGAFNAVTDSALQPFIESSVQLISSYPKAKQMELANREITSNIFWNVKATSDVGLDKVLEMSENTSKIISSERIILGVIAVIVLIIGGFLIVFITNSITKPIIEGIGVANKLAEGDLTATMHLDRKDEIGLLAQSLNMVSVNLKSIIGDLVDNADKIGEASTHLSKSAEDISEGSRQQSAATEEISSSMEQMQANVNQSTDNAHQTQRIAESTAKEITKNVDSFKEASVSLKQIVQKVSIVDEIAFLTNILALNAAVEAARAGEHGRGFAVVAHEVRRLAEKSKDAASDINSVSKSTLELSQNAEKELNFLAPEIRKTASLVHEISVSGAEQSAGIEQINKAMQQLNTVVNENASRSDEMTEHSEKMAVQAANLREIIAKFKI